MAVFPDRIVLKNSSDGDSAIRSAIGAGGTDEISPGEVVLGLGNGFASFYTLDSLGSVVEIVSGGNVTVAGVNQVNNLGGYVTLAGSNLSDIKYNGDPLFDFVTLFIPGYGIEGEVPTAAYGSTPGAAGLAENVQCVSLPVNSYATSTSIANGVYRRSGNQLSLGTDEWAIEFKINVPDPSNDVYLLFDGVDESVDKSFFFWWDSTNSQFKFEYYDGDTATVRTLTFSTTLNANTWTYLELLRTSNDKIILYVYDETSGSRSSGATDILSTTTVGARTSGGFDIGAVTLNGSIDRASTFFFQDFRITRGAVRGTSTPIPESQYGPSTFQDNKYIQAEGDVLRWNPTDESWNPAGNYGRAIVSDSAPTADPSGATLLEGQSWYDFSTNNYHVYYNSAWVQAGGGGGGGTLGGLTDVDLSTPATDGQVIAYNATSGNWEPVNQSGGGGYTDPLTTNGDIVIRSGGVTTRLGIGTSGQVLTVTGGVPSWENAAGGATSLNDLTDVDTSTVTPTDGQVLTWVDANNQWEPATPAGGGSETLEGLTDTYTADTGERYLNEGTHPTGAETETGNYSIYNYSSSNKGLYLNRTDANGNDVFGMFPPGFVFQNGGTSGSLRVSNTSGTGYTDYQWNYVLTDEGIASPVNPQWFKFNFDSKPLPPTGQGSLYFTTTVTTSSGGPSDGQVLTWVDANSQWEPVDAAGGGGATTLNELTDVNAPSPVDNDLLMWQGSEWVPASFGDGGFQESSGDLTQFPLHGIDGFYADQAALEADGFTFIASSANADDSALSFSPGASWDGISFLGQSPVSANWFVNSNGGVGFDVGGSTTTDRSGNSVQASAGIDLYVSWWSQDTETRLAGYKEVTIGGTDWLIVRADMKVPFSSDTKGFPVEAWFSKKGEISIRYGTSVGGASITVSATANVICGSGSVYAGTSAPFTSLSSSGAYGISYSLEPTIPIDLDDLSDVDTTTTAPTDGQVLTWVDANSQWEPEDLQGAAVRAALGIGEYADDAAAGTGGVASGAMYYNTTSSDYRLKT